MFESTSFLAGRIIQKIQDCCGESGLIHFDIADNEDLSEIIDVIFEKECVSEVSITKCESAPEIKVLHISLNSCEPDK